MMKTTKILITMFALLLLVGITSANVTDERSYFSEDTAIPFEMFVVLAGVGLLFLVIATFTGFSYWGGPTMIFGLISCGFLTVSAYAAPVTGFYSYVTNSTTNATAQVTPIVWLVMQPWMSWLLWGMALVSFFLFVFGILILFRERAHEDDMDWV